ncbi:MAG: hypothetical protein V1701_01545 [Planctomycetota bacterium]
MKRTMIMAIGLALLLILGWGCGSATLKPVEPDSDPGKPDVVKPAESNIPTPGKMAVPEPPKALYFGADDDAVGKAIRQAGFDVVTADSFDAGKDDLKKFQLVVVVDYAVCSQKLADALKEFAGQGGGMILFSGVPSALPYPELPHDLTRGFNDISYIAEWFGASQYVNVGGNAATTMADAFGTKLLAGSLLETSASGSSAGIDTNSLDKNAKIVATWEDGPVYAFTYCYKDGRVYYQSSSKGGGWAGEVGLELIRGAARWAANLPPADESVNIRPQDQETRQLTPELQVKIAKLIQQFGDEQFENREAAQNELITVGEIAIPELEQALQNPDAQIKMSAQAILKSFGFIPDEQLEKLQNSLFDAILASEDDEDAERTIRRILGEFAWQYRPKTTRTYRTKDKDLAIIIGANGQDGKEGAKVSLVDYEAKLVIAIGGDGSFAKEANNSPICGEGGGATAQADKGIAVALGGKGVVYDYIDGESHLFGDSSDGFGGVSSSISVFGFAGKGEQSGGMVSTSTANFSAPPDNLKNAKKFIEQQRLIPNKK